MDISAITNVIMGIAAQGAVTVTIPNDSDLVRDLGPVEMTRQIGPIELRIQTGPAKTTVKAAPAETTVQANPAETTVQAAPAETTIQAAPVEPKSEAAPAKTEKQAAPVKTESKAAPTKVASQTPAAQTSRDVSPAQETGYSGLWYDHTGRSAIKISNCGEGLCGRIAWLKDQAHTSACGTDIIGGVHKVGDLYDNGWIYDIERDKKFDVELKLLNEKELRVKGYLGSKLFSKTFVWNRAPGNLELCS